MKRIEYIHGTVSQVIEMGEKGEGYILIDIEKSFGKPVISAPSHLGQLRLDMVEGLETGDKVKLVFEVEK